MQLTRDLFAIAKFLFYTSLTIGFLKKLWVNVSEMFGRGRPSDKEYSIRFWDSIATCRTVSLKL